MIVSGYRKLRQAGFATLLIDLLTAEEEKIDLRTRHLRFDIALLAERVAYATDWVIERRGTRHLAIGYFGASTGAAAALVAASQRPQVTTVVSRGGRPDLAGNYLPEVRAATLLRIVTFATGASSVRNEVVDALAELLNRGVTPVVPRYGSVGASGDLMPSAYIARVLVGMGEAEFEGRRMPAAEAAAQSRATSVTAGGA